MEIRKIIKHGNSSAIVVPRAYLRELRWGRGDHVAFCIVDDVLHVTALRNITAAITPHSIPAKETDHVTY